MVLDFEKKISENMFLTMFSPPYIFTYIDMHISVIYKTIITCKLIFINFYMYIYKCI